MFGDDVLTFSSEEIPEWAESRRTELKGLKEQKMFSITRRDLVPIGTILFRTRWVDTVTTRF
jgi:hypothetical protein